MDANAMAATTGIDNDRIELSSRVVAEMLKLIEHRHYLPGERLPSERDLAVRFGVGRTTIREAVTTLESMRYLERRPGSGLYRCRQPEAASLETLVLFSDLGLPLDAKTNAEVVEVRRLIEVQAIGLACDRRQDVDLERSARRCRGSVTTTISPLTRLGMTRTSTSTSSGRPTTMCWSAWSARSTSWRGRGAWCSSRIAGAAGFRINSTPRC